MNPGDLRSAEVHACPARVMPIARPSQRETTARDQGLAERTQALFCLNGNAPTLAGLLDCLAARPLIKQRAFISTFHIRPCRHWLPDQRLSEIPCPHHVNVIGVRFRLGALGRTWHARSRNHRRKPRLEQVVQKQTHENSDAEAHGETVPRVSSNAARTPAFGQAARPALAPAIGRMSPSCLYAAKTSHTTQSPARTPVPCRWQTRGPGSPQTGHAEVSVKSPMHRRVDTARERSFATAAFERQQAGGDRPWERAAS